MKTSELKLQGLLKEIQKRHNKLSVVILTGAGISAESGIPTFRGSDGYWTVGSENYQPQEMGTWKMFQQHPKHVWSWYLYRRSVCAAASPNVGHVALASMEEQLGSTFTLITQNVDGLHLRAGNSLTQTYQIHGNINFMRCSKECCYDLHETPLPANLGSSPDTSMEVSINTANIAQEKFHISDEDFALLVCPHCGAMTRPHILWWDEYYNDELYFWNRSITAAQNADILIIVGTSGATNLPNQVADIALHNGALVIDINTEENHFSRLVGSHLHGISLRGSATEVLPKIVGAIVGLATPL